MITDPVLRPEIRSKYLAFARGDFSEQLSFFQDEEVVFLDFEATGIDPSKDQIIEIGALLVKGGKVAKSFNTLVKPSISIPAYIVYATKINDDMIKSAPSIEQVFPKLMDIIGSRTVIAYADFERQFLRRYLHELLDASFDNRYIDVLELARIILPSLHSHRQVDIASFFNIPVRAAHRAYEDVQVLKDIYQILLNGVSSLDEYTLRQLASLSPKTDWVLRELFANIGRHSRKKKRLPSASNRLNWKRKFDEKPSEGRYESELKPLDAEKLKEVFSEKGPLASQFDAYETRKEQLEMVLHCATAFTEQKHLVIEAGTGTGKSLAYLVPSIYFAVQNDLPVIISTKSINLQDQLYLKDLPFLHRVLDVDFSSCVLKGYRNYLCQRKFHRFLEEEISLTPEQISLAAMVIVWLQETDDGDVSRLNIHSDHGLWSKICGSPSNCLRKRCPWKNQNGCFYYQAKERARHSHLVIVNHSLLFENLKLGDRLLPAASYLIIDEAHAIEDESTEQLTGKLGCGELFGFLKSLYLEQGMTSSGFLIGIVKRLPRNISSVKRREIFKQVKDLTKMGSKAQAAADQFFQSLILLRGRGCLDSNYNSSEVRITPELTEEPVWEGVHLSGSNCLSSLVDLQRGLETLYQKLTALEGLKAPADEEMMVDLLNYVLSLTGYIEVLEMFLKDFSPGQVNWVTFSRDAELESISISVAPLEVGDILAERFFTEKNSVIMTSATLTVSDSFAYFLNRVGLDRLRPPGSSDGEVYSTVQLPSSFDFERQTKVYLVSDIDEPDSLTYETDLSDFLIDVHLATQGGVLTLFTNNRLMRQVYFAVLETLAREGLIVLCQNVGASRQKLVRDFIADRKASLFGTASFWEGFDASGDTLRCIVVTRLPFSRPNQPMIEARCEALKKNGLSPFNHYLLPQAALRLKQGVGRLIRTKNDRGLIVIADPRLCRKSYSSQFFSALPRCDYEIKTKGEIVVDIANWMKRK